MAFSMKDLVRRGRTGRNTIVEEAGLYVNPSDDWGIPRANAGDHLQSPYHLMSLNPLASIFHQYGFFNAYDVNTTNVWDQVASGSGTGLTVQAGRGGYAKIVNGASDNHHYYYQAKYQTATLAAGKMTWLIGEIMIKDVDQCDMFFGLCKTIASGEIFANRVDAVGFYMTDGSALLRCETSKASTATQASSAVSAVDLTRVRLALTIEAASKVHFFIDGVHKKTITTNIPTANLAVSFGLQNGEGAANEMTIYPIRLGMEI
jgi:hypothetical protein